MEKRVISTQLQEEDYKIESSLRPQRLEDYIGQEKIKSNMKYGFEDLFLFKFSRFDFKFKQKG